MNFKTLFYIVTKCFLRLIQVGIRYYPTTNIKRGIKNQNQNRKGQKKPCIDGNKEDDEDDGIEIQKTLSSIRELFNKEYTIEVGQVLWFAESRCIKKGQMFKLSQYNFLLGDGRKCSKCGEYDTPEKNWEMIGIYSKAETGIWIVTLRNTFCKKTIYARLNSTDIKEKFPEPPEEGVYMTQSQGILGYNIFDKFRVVSDTSKWNDIEYYKEYMKLMKYIYNKRKLDISIGVHYKLEEIAHGIKLRCNRVYEKRVSTGLSSQMLEHERIEETRAHRIKGE